MRSPAPAWLQMAVLILALGITLATFVGAAVHLGFVALLSSAPPLRTSPTAAMPIPDPAPTVLSKLPGPPREWTSPDFILSESNSLSMKGRNLPDDERWRDLADNPYSARFRAEFSYEPGAARTPVVRSRIAPTGPTFAGRIEARGLKPNFVYQIKLRGLYPHRRAYETIGYLGRWRLPGRLTNYTDYDYLRYPDKSKVESYILFDFFITDRSGNAIREFALDSTLHVLWKESQIRAPSAADRVPVAVDATDPAVYAFPREGIATDFIWAELEVIRQPSRDRVVRLPPGEYSAELVLTEESFHSGYHDGGYWATVLACPVSFSIIAP